MEGNIYECAHCGDTHNNRIVPAYFIPRSEIYPHSLPSRKECGYLLCEKCYNKRISDLTTYDQEFFKRVLRKD